MMKYLSCSKKNEEFVLSEPVGIVAMRIDELEAEIERLQKELERTKEEIKNPDTGWNDSIRFY